MAASSSTAGEIKYALQNDSDGLRIALAGGAFDTIIPSASTFLASSSRTKYVPFDIFINHYGKDTKHTLATQIYNSLNERGLKVFLDKDELKLGDLLHKALEEGMAGASIYIAIFSEHYAQSPWCLAELEFMVKSRKTIIPIFHYVEPFVLRWADGGKGAYADAFREYEKKGRYPREVLQRWQKALHQVSFHVGCTINNTNDEQRVVKDVVNRVTKKMNIVPLDVAKYPVSMDETVQYFDNTIALTSAGSTKIVAGIWGMGGSGKTTLAKEIFNRRSSNMDWFSFLSDVRDAAGKGQLLDKQKTLLRDLGAKDEFDNLDKGKQILKNRLSRSVSVLIVLDDVDHIDQLDALLPPKESLDSLGDQSLIIVTTRDENVLRRWGLSATYTMKRLNDDHAKQLFCRHAFLQISPPSEFEVLVEKFLTACQGLPLSLKVLGGQLCGKSDMAYWQDTLKKYSQIPHMDIAKRLKVSYDALEKDEQEMFLDAACLFIGQRRSAAIAAWDAEFCGTFGWDTLLSKCLVEEDEYGLIRMHDHLRDLGRDIANGQSPLRLWSPEQIIKIPPGQQVKSMPSFMGLLIIDMGSSFCSYILSFKIFLVFTSTIQEAIRVRGITNAVGYTSDHGQGKIIIKTTNQEAFILTVSLLGLKIFIGNGEFLSRDFSEVSKELIWLQCDKFEHKNLALKELRILALSDSRSLEHLLTDDAALTELDIRVCERLAGFPSSIGRFRNLKRIVIDGFFSGALSGLPQEFCYLQSLEHLVMTRCLNLSSLPSNFGKLTKLRHLDLEWCTKLETLPGSFKKLTLLEYLRLEGCEELTIKSELNVFENMTKLRYLNLGRCKKMENLRLPESVSLSDLHLKWTGLKELPANIFHLTKLIKLEIGSDFLTTLPTCVPNLSPLTTLTIEGCKKLESLPDSLENLTDLRDLTMEDTGVQCLPKSLIHLQSLTIKSTPVSELNFGSWCMLKSKFSSLKKLVLENCKKLEKIESLENSISLEELNISRCPELKALPSLAEITSLKTIQLGYCNKLENVEVSTSLKNIGLEYLSKLEKIEGLEKIRSLQTLVIDSCPKLSGLPDLAKLPSLKEFVLKGCKDLKKIESFKNITSLQKLVIYECPILDGLEGLAKLTSLKEFELEWCKKLEKIESLEHLKSLEKLKISECPELEVLPSFPETTSLKEFQLVGCHKLEKIESLEHLKSLEELKISECPELEVLPSLLETTSLKEFQLKGCHKLEKVKGLGNITCLQKLMIYDCPISEGLQGLAKLTSLKKIELERCNKLEKIESLEDLKSLEELNITDCPELEVLFSVPETISLKEIKLERCHKLEKVESFKNIRSLEKLTICDCPKLDGLQDLTKLTSLKYIRLHKCNKLQKIESLENLRLLKELGISDCPELEAIASHSETLRSLERLEICDCPRLGGLLSLAELPSLEGIILSKCSKLKKLKICNCPQLDYLSLGELTSLEEFELQRCPKLRRLSIYDFPQLNILFSLAELPSLKSINLTNCPKLKLKKIEGLENIKSSEELRISHSPELTAIKITSLKKLELKNCYNLEKIECWKHLKSLEELSLSDCSELEVLSSLAEMTFLKRFELVKCSKLKKMEGLENIKSLEKLKISDCSELEALPEITSLKILQLEKWHNKIEGLENMSSLEELNISDCSELETLPEITSLKRLELKRCPRLKKIDGLGNIKSLEELNISDCSELESLPSLSETSLKVLKLEKCDKVEGLERLTLLQNLEVHSCWNAPCIVSLEHSQSLCSLVVVADNISVVEPFVTSIQEWPRKVMICTRTVCDMGWLKNFFQNLPNVSVVDYTDGVEVDSDWCGKHLELRAPKSSARGNAILRCFIIDNDHPDLRFCIYLGPCDASFRTKLGEGKWVWMGVYTNFYLWGSSLETSWIFARNSEGEDVKVRVEAAWLVIGEEESIVDTFRQHFQRNEERFQNKPRLLTE